MKVRSTLRASLWLLAAAIGLLARPTAAQMTGNPVPVRIYTGYYNDTAVYFSAFETNDANFATTNGLVYAPRLTQVNESALPQMIFFNNAAGRQTVVLQTQPGQPDYNPLWQVVTATWSGATAMPLITNYAQAVQLNQQGSLLVQRTGILFNGPVITVNRPLDLSNSGTPAPTIPPGKLLSIDQGSRTAYFNGEQGYYNGQVVTFLAMEHAPGSIQFAPGALPVPTISANALGATSVANFYEIEGQPPVIDSIPVRQVVVAPGNPPTTVSGAGIASVSGKPVTVPSGQTGQTGQDGTGTLGQPVGGSQGGQQQGGQTGGQIGGQTGDQTGGYQQPGTVQPAAEGQYSPIWIVHRVVFRTGVQRQLLRSVQEIQQAAAAGLVDVIQGQGDATFNCPVPFFYQAGSPNPIPTYSPGTGTIPGGTTVTPPGGTTTPPGTGY